MTKEVEDIINNKSFSELTNDERSRLGELAENEEEYANVKWFLASATTSFQSSKISASPKVKTKVMEHLANERNRKGFWLNSVGVILMPTEKPLYKKPLIQFGVAAALIVGFLAYMNNPGLDENLAVVDADQIENTNLNQSIVDEETPKPIGISELEAESTIEPNIEKRALDNAFEGITAPKEDMKVELIEDDELFNASSRKDQPNILMDDGIIAPAVTTASSNEQKSLNLEVDMMDKVADRQKKESESNAITNTEVEEVGSGVFRNQRNDVYFSSSAELAKTKEEITPKTLHIDKTKELNQLFFIIK